MKAKTILFSFSILFFISSFTFNPQEFEVKIKNLENRKIVAEGLKPSEFSELSVITKNQKLNLCK